MTDADKLKAYAEEQRRAEEREFLFRLASRMEAMEGQIQRLTALHQTDRRLLDKWHRHRWRDPKEELPKDDKLYVVIANGTYGKIRLSEALDVACYDKREKAWFLNGAERTEVDWWMDPPAWKKEVDD